MDADKKMDNSDQNQTMGQIVLYMINNLIYDEKCYLIEWTNAEAEACKHIVKSTAEARRQVIDAKFREKVRWWGLKLFMANL